MITVDEKRGEYIWLYHCRSQLLAVLSYGHSIECLVMVSSPVPGIGAHDMEITSNDKHSFLLLCQPDWISIIVHSKLPEDEQCT